MIKAGWQCHSSQWKNIDVIEFDKIVSGCSIIWEYTDSLFKKAYDGGLISGDNPLDETPEIMYYPVLNLGGRRIKTGTR